MSAARGRIAILHFTAAPCVGGVEQVITLQRDVLHGAGYETRLIVGAGGEGASGTIVLPALLPSPETLNARVPPTDHPAVLTMRVFLETMLAECDQCWIHNVLTVYLNPFLTVALLQLIREMPRMRWVAFCHDVTATTAFWRSLEAAERQRVALPRGDITYVVDGHPVREYLLQAGVTSTRILTLPPAIDPFQWLGLTNEVRELCQSRGLMHADPLILTPSKLLPHKNLQLGMALVRALRDAGRAPTLLITGAASPHDRKASEVVRTDLVRLSQELGVAQEVILLTEALGVPPTSRMVRDLMLLADLVFLPSAEEGFGLPLREAMMLRAPLLCSAISPFVDGAVGYATFFNLGDPVQAIARQAETVCSTAANARRHEALQSYEQFCDGIRALATGAQQSDIASFSARTGNLL